MQGRTHVLAGKEAVHCRDGCSALQGRMQCTARADAVHCGSGCSALRLRWVKLAPKSSVLFWIRDKGGETHPIRVSVAPLEISTEPIYLVILVLFAASDCKKAVKRAASLRKLPLYLRAHLMRTRLAPYAELIYSLTTTLSMPT